MPGAPRPFLVVGANVGRFTSAASHTLRRGFDVVQLWLTRSFLPILPFEQVPLVEGRLLMSTGAGSLNYSF